MVMQAGQLCCKKCCLIFGATTARKLVKIYFRNPEWVNSYYTQRPKIQPHTYTGLRNMQMWRDGAVRGCHVAAVRSLVPCSSELAPLLLPVHTVCDPCWTWTSHHPVPKSLQTPHMYPYLLPLTSCVSGCMHALSTSKSAHCNQYKKIFFFFSF